MSYYKFCSSAHVDLVAAGGLRFSSLAYFRHLEQRDEKAWIGDKLEGKAETTLPLLKTDGFDAEERRVAGLFGVNVQPGALGTTLQDMVAVEDCGHWLIFSFSAGDLAALRGVMGATYDAAVELLDYEGFARAIYETGQTHLGPVNRLFAPPIVREMTYEPRQGVFDGVELIRASPFLKHPGFGPQSEMRIAMRPHNQREVDVLDVRVAGADKLLRTAYANSSAPVAAVAAKSDEVLAGEMEELAARIQRLQRGVAMAMPMAPEHAVVIDEKLGTLSVDHQLATQWQDACVSQWRDCSARIESECWGAALALYWEARLRGYRYERDASFDRSTPPNSTKMHMVLERTARLVRAALQK